MWLGHIIVVREREEVTLEDMIPSTTWFYISSDTDNRSWSIDRYGKLLIALRLTGALRLYVRPVQVSETVAYKCNNEASSFYISKPSTKFEYSPQRKIGLSRGNSGTRSNTRYSGLGWNPPQVQRRGGCL